MLTWKFLVLSLAATAVLAGCGVKGRPLPPVTPVPLGDGRLKGQKPPQDKPATTVPSTRRNSR
ncbi:MAG: hypothetical protein KF802_09290 [Bdellovibrionaceae bacterium]|nr:hypothetical protein [Pseudobdellovibrionaceae bacterium]MBX3033690.1 hypothetical protein [Pseudobdellovibrionaceae bacterium]